MLKQYASHFFPETITRFVDLFAGALTNTLWVEEYNPNIEFVVNDFNSELISLYDVLSKHENEVITEWGKCVSVWLTSSPEDRKKFYYELREEYCHEFMNRTDVRLSGILLFMMQVNFNGMWKVYHKCNLRYSTPPGTCTQSQKFFDENKIRRVCYVLKKCTFVTGDFSDVPIREGDFLYADPPYRDSIVLYQGGFSESDQVRLAKLLTSHSGPFAYSNKDIGDGFYEKHFVECNIHRMSATYTAGRGTSTHSVSEVLVTNF